MNCWIHRSSRAVLCSLPADCFQKVELIPQPFLQGRLREARPCPRGTCRPWTGRGRRCAWAASSPQLRLRPAAPGTRGSAATPARRTSPSAPATATSAPRCSTSSTACARPATTTPRSFSSASGMRPAARGSSFWRALGCLTFPLGRWWLWGFSTNSWAVYREFRDSQKCSYRFKIGNLAPTTEQEKNKSLKTIKLMKSHCLLTPLKGTGIRALILSGGAGTARPGWKHASHLQLLLGQWEKLKIAKAGFIFMKTIDSYIPESPCSYSRMSM